MFKTNKYQLFVQTNPEFYQNVQNQALLLRGKVNISQLQGEIEFNTFLCDKPYN